MDNETYDYDDFRTPGTPHDTSPEAEAWLDEEHEAHPDFITVTIH